MVCMCVMEVGQETARGDLGQDLVDRGRETFQASGKGKRPVAEKKNAFIQYCTYKQM